MTRGSLYRVDNNSCVVPEASLAETITERMRGLLGYPPLEKPEALIIKPCSSVHTIGMKYNLDLAFLNRDWVIIKIVRAIKPWRISACPSAHMVIEFLEGSLEHLQLTPGTQLKWQQANTER